MPDTPITVSCRVTMPPAALAVFLQTVRRWQARRAEITMTIVLEMPNHTTAEIAALLARQDPPLQQGTITPFPPEDPPHA